MARRRFGSFQRRSSAGQGGMRAQFSGNSQLIRHNVDVANQAAGLSTIGDQKARAYPRRSDGHRFWYTHKNPHGCWICDLIFTIEQYSRCIDDLVQTGNTNPRTSDSEGQQLLDEEHNENT